jgi:hypothetical protein
MLFTLFIVLLLMCVVAPLRGVDTSDARSESARPAEGWFAATPQAR